MMFSKRVLASAAVLATLSFTPALSGGGPLSSGYSAPVEVTGPAAKGDAKPFRTFVQAECGGGVCIADFGKKGNKVRTVKWISCGINTDGGVLQLGQIVLTDMVVPVAFLPTVSRGVTGDDEIALMEFAQTFDVPAGEFLRVQMITSGAALGAQCVVSGTIK